MINRKYIAEGKALGHMRKSAGLTQTQAAELVCSTLRTWQDWEYGISRMHPGLMQLLRIKIGSQQSPTR